MTPTQLRKAIDRLGFKSAYEFGAWINRRNPDTGRRMTRRWLADEAEIPYYVEFVIDLQRTVLEQEAVIVKLRREVSSSLLNSN